MPGQFDFSPQSNPLSGVSLSDLIAARTTPVTQIANAASPLLNILTQRKLQQQKQMQAQQFLQGMYSPQVSAGTSSLSPEQLMAGVESGMLNTSDLANLSPLGQSERRAKTTKYTADSNLAQAKADQIKSMADQGYYVVENPQTGTASFVPIPGFKGNNGGKPVATVKKEPTPYEKAQGETAGKFAGLTQGIQMLKGLGQNQQQPQPAAQQQAAPAGTIMVSEVDSNNNVVRRLPVPAANLPRVKQAILANGNRMVIGQ